MSTQNSSKSVLLLTSSISRTDRHIQTYKRLFYAQRENRGWNGYKEIQWKWNLSQGSPVAGSSEHDGNFGFHERRVIPWQAKRLAYSQEELCSLQLFIHYDNQYTEVDPAPINAHSHLWKWAVPDNCVTSAVAKSLFLIPLDTRWCDD
jgi:hypothetical protein